MLKGDRVLLSAVTRKDIKTYWRFRSDVGDRAARGSTPAAPALPRGARGRLQRPPEAPTGNPWFAIEAGGKFILHTFDRAAINCELAITIGDRDYWSKGYGREVVTLLLD